MPAIKRKRYSDEQISSILKKHEAGMKVQGLVRMYGISEQSIYCWRDSVAARLPAPNPRYDPARAGEWWNPFANERIDPEMLRRFLKPGQ